jgi:hypothetical protein
MTTTAPSSGPTAEHARLAQATGRAEDGLSEANPWYQWGPYLSERAWGTVREDYSDNGDAWSFFPHDHARSRAYRWNEDGMAGLSDIHHDLCLALALWNGVDPILKERMNHGQLEGATVHLPVFLGRYPIEPTDSAHLAFYRSFLPALADPTFRHGRWRLCDRSGWLGDDRYQNLVTWCWEGDTRWLIIVNLSDSTAAGRVRAPRQICAVTNGNSLTPRETSLSHAPATTSWTGSLSSYLRGSGTCSVSIR